MTTQRHGTTEAPVTGFEARIQQAFEWIAAHPRQVIGTLAAILVVGGVAAGIWEWRSRGEAAAQEALERTQRSLAEKLGGDPRLTLIPEPANQDLARAAREAALAGLDAVATEHATTRAAAFARLRAAEVALDLGKRDDALTRLDALVGALAADDPLRAIALRLAGYIRVEQQDFAGAAESYAQAGGVASYPDQGAAWYDAGRNYERAGAFDRAADAYAKAVAADPELAEREGIVDRMAAVQARGVAVP
jgi:tetratricopeptide (TPR) repeat protein